MHHIYHTQGIVLSSRNFGETGKTYALFTRDLGMVYATAQGVRKMSSKLRFVLQDFAYLKIDLVKGKDFWRITSVSRTDELEKLSRPGTFPIFANIARLLKRLLSGEEANEELFNDLLQGLSVLEKAETKEELENTEAILVLRILYRLGYIGAGETLEDFTQSPFAEELLFKVSKNRAKILRQINQALKETHL